MKRFCLLHLALGPSQQRNVALLLAVLCLATTHATPVTEVELRSKVDLCRQFNWNTAHPFCRDMVDLDTSLVTDMSGLFYQDSTFNVDISHWNTGRVTDMSNMFAEAQTFNSDITGWDTSSVSDMSGMFAFASEFDQDLSRWNTGAVKTMTKMFFEAHSFNGNLSGWNTNSVRKMSGMFAYATSFNAQISGWNTSSVLEMSGMFAYATSFNTQISGWKTGNVDDMTAMFLGAAMFNNNISKWDVSTVRNMERMFNGAAAFNADISQWNVSSVSTMGAMFMEASSFNADISGWDVRKVTDSDNMFVNASSFNVNLCTWQLGFQGARILDNWNYGDQQPPPFDITRPVPDPLDPAATNTIVEARFVDARFEGSPKFSLCDVDECLAGSDICPDNAECHNTDGSYQCECNLGFAHLPGSPLYPFEGKVYKPLYERADYDAAVAACASQGGALPIVSSKAETDLLRSFFCVQDSNTACEAQVWLGMGRENPDAQWTWRDGTPVSTPADVIFTYQSDSRARIFGEQEVSDWEDAPASNEYEVVCEFASICLDVDECQDMPCLGVNEECHNTPGSFECSCEAGFQRGRDIPKESNCFEERNVTECDDVTCTRLVCDADEYCCNTEWDSLCVQAANFVCSSDCSDVQECASGHTCDISAWCVNTEGSFFCDCPLAQGRGRLDDFSCFELLVDDQSLREVVDRCRQVGWAEDANPCPYLPLLDTRRVTNTSGLFRGDAAFNLNITSWDMSGVTDMASMFEGAESFNGDISGWDTGRVTDMSSMFSHASAFNGDISSWNTGKVSTMRSMFRGHWCASWNRYYCTAVPITFNGNLSLWNTSNLEDVASMFHEAYDFNGDLSGWNTHKVTNMSYMFYRAESFNGDISRWDTSSVQDMNFMFYTADVFNGDVSRWNTSSVTTMHYLFCYAVEFNSDISRWDTSKVLEMDWMFWESHEFNQNLSTWNVSRVTSLEGMFSAAYVFNGDVSTWNTSSVVRMGWIFDYTPEFNGDISRWDVSNVQEADAVFNLAFVFNGDLSRWNTSSMRDVHRMFYGAEVFNGNLSEWDTSSMFDVHSMFERSAFNTDISRWNTSSFIDMSSMLSHTPFNGDVSRWDTRRVQEMNYVFSGCSYSRCIQGSFNGDLSRWNTSSATSMHAMFQSSPFNGAISTWDTSKVRNMGFMFAASQFNGDISGWDTSRVTSFWGMFQYSPFNVDLCGWDINVNPAHSYALADMFKSTPKLSLCDVNECHSGTDNCHTEASCSNTDGSFQCTCREGWGPLDNGTTCTPWAPSSIPECQESRTWRELTTAFRDRGSNPDMVTGGLGNLMIPDRYEAWACLRGHACLHALNSSAPEHDFMCFAFDEHRKSFVPWGMDSGLHLVGDTSSSTSNRRHSTSSMSVTMPPKASGLDFPARVARLEETLLGAPRPSQDLLEARIVYLESVFFGSASPWADQGLQARLVAIEAQIWPQ